MDTQITLRHETIFFDFHYNHYTINELSHRYGLQTKDIKQILIRVYNNKKYKYKEAEFIINLLCQKRD